MLMHGHNIYGHLDGSLTSPTITIAHENTQIPHPDYALWFCQDQLIQNALIASVEPTIASTVAIAPSAKHA